MTPFTPTLVVGLAGPSGAGKSTLAAILARPPFTATVLPLDAYFTLPKDGLYDNYWDLRCYDVRAFMDALAALKTGRAVQAPVLDYRDFTRIGHQNLEPASIVVAEGMALFRIPSILSLIEIPIFLNPTSATVLARKRLRDQRDRGRPPDEVDAQWAWISSEWANDLQALPPSVHILDDEDPLPSIQNLISQWPSTEL
jgi:uridine kinase